MDEFRRGTRRASGGLAVRNGLVDERRVVKESAEQRMERSGTRQMRGGRVGEHLQACIAWARARWEEDWPRWGICCEDKMGLRVRLS